ncbi:TPA: conjugal transfer protein TrbC [Enterobacter mori]|uniref:conjugal transfer protein TrbC n=1 Tax=Enterobacteriaceae TaxID=543 RepID=UPI000B7F20BE|nr:MULTISPECIES: conjugal transfer protein TrbC [Enterobacteriaceae]MBF2792979.1 conjugal transfer protein TrbC [Enterobacter asburiae]MDX7584743.1 conjugal transfer protein TrbC [Klebsiella pneumoniae]OXL31175.1 conjugal transfer protein TrbC [Enterobacter mori]CAH8249984.1 Uncharacterised protein [Enterobacter ludwigii]CAH8250115.1 Uncharacterised protein [Enterobacter mori]
MTFRTIKNAATRLMASLLALPAVPALAASADQAFQKGSDAIGLTSMSVVTISCAVAFIAYKMLVDGKAWHDLKRVFWAGVLLAGASGFGAYFSA